MEEQPIKIKIIKEDKPEEGEKETKWEKIGRICLYLLAALTPVFFLPLTIAPVEINKQIFAGLLILIALICYLINSFEKGKIIYPKSLLSSAVIILLAVFGASAVFSKAKVVSLYGNLVQSDSLMSFIIYGLAFFLAAVFYRTDGTNKAARIHKIGFYFFISLAIVAVFGLLQLFGKFILPWDFTKQAGFNPLGTILSLGIYLAFGLTMALAVLFGGGRADGIKKIGLIGLGLLIIFELIILNNSSLWLVLAFSALLLAAYNFVMINKLNPALVIIIGLFLFLGFVGQSLPALTSLPIEVRPNLSTTFEIIRGGFGFPRFLIGKGPAAFGYDYALYRPIELNYTNLWSFRFNQGFSFLTTLLATAGILGILAILFLIFCFIRELRLMERISLIGGLGIIFLLLNWLFAPNFFTQSLFIFVGLGLITALTSPVKEISLAELPRRKVFIIFILLIVLVAVSFASIFNLGKKYLGAVYYERGLRDSQAGDLNKALIQVNKARGLDSRQDQYLRTFSQLLILRAEGLARQGPSMPEAQSELQNTAALAIETALQAVKINELDSLNWSNLGNIYERIIPIAQGADVFAEENYKKAAELDPKNPQEPVNISRSLLLTADLIGSANSNLRQEKLNKAKSYLEKSITLKSDYAPAHFLFAAIAMREGKTQEAIQKLELTKQLAPFDTGLSFQLGVVYYQNNQLEKARLEFERAVGINPDYSNARYFLGLIYDRFGNKAAALEQFEKIAILNPENQEVKKILNNLNEGRSALEDIVPPAQPPTERLEEPVQEIKR